MDIDLKTGSIIAAAGAYAIYSFWPKIKSLMPEPDILEAFEVLQKEAEQLKGDECTECLKKLIVPLIFGKKNEK